MSWRLATSLQTLRAQVNAAFPTRDKASDGTVGDLSHSARKSDHNPNSAGVVTAWDCDADLAPTVTVGTLVDTLFQNKDPRLKYIIFNGRITYRENGKVAGWKAYTGPNAHKHHAHISVASDPKLYDDASPWNLGFLAPPTIPARRLQMGMKGEFVTLLQDRLIARGFLARGQADGRFGPLTKAAVQKLRESVGLDPGHGFADEQTLKELGL